ncbi:hypothetical protein RESH_05001 [Rhodopirellula europaea SH398]|uniref:Uncharacterized protein n=1 Tax=Rhodopirellula europaea SH398 TaxID=1263868 RepID=M5RZA4_9BACT|nr:hypothetical protein RESH_05001 [Rhodopirellula europaea SH398]
MGGYAADEEARSKLDEAFQPVPLSVPTLPQSLRFPEKYGPGRILSGVLKTALLFFVDSSIAVRKPLGVRIIATKFLGNRYPKTLVRMSNDHGTPLKGNAAVPARSFWTGRRHTQ